MKRDNLIYGPHIFSNYGSLNQISKKEKVHTAAFIDGTDSCLHFELLSLDLKIKQMTRV